MKEWLARHLPQLWYRRRLAPLLLPLLPLSALFAVLGAARRLAYRWRLVRVHYLRQGDAPDGAVVPVIVIGNLIAGGAGKTPLTIALARELGARGYRPGIVSRGYGAAPGGPRLVTAASSCHEVGDEALLLARQSAAPLAVGRDRVAAARLLLASHPECDLLLADDGLQHYRLGRHCEIVVFDARGAGNRCLLPAGPLREPLSRLAQVDAIVLNGVPGALPRSVGRAPRFAMRLDGATFRELHDAGRRCAAPELAGRNLHAVAGIGDPGRFFRHLEGLGLSFIAHPFPDHHPYTARELAFGDDAVLLMTEKDAVKCAGLAVGEAWVLPVSAAIEDGLLAKIMEKIDGRAPA